MAYTTTNYRTKKALKEAVKAGERVTVFQPGPFGPDVTANGSVSIEGPHYPEAHRWYAQCTIANGSVVAVT